MLCCALSAYLNINELCEQQYFLETFRVKAITMNLHLTGMQTHLVSSLMSKCPERNLENHIRIDISSGVKLELHLLGQLLLSAVIYSFRTVYHKTRN